METRQSVLDTMTFFIFHGDTAIFMGTKFGKQARSPQTSCEFRDIIDFENKINDIPLPNGGVGWVIQPITLSLPI